MKFHRLISALALVLFLSCLVGLARADTVTGGGIIAPTKNTNGSDIAATGPGSLTSAKLEYGTCNGTAFGTKQGEVVKATPVTSISVDLSPGAYCFQVRHQNTYGNWSAPSNVVAKTVDPPTPNAGVLGTVVTVSVTVVTTQ